MKIIKELLGIGQERKVYEFNPGVRTTTPDEVISYIEWCNKFKVSCLHGKQITYLG
jgi:hypothetical protein